MLILWDIFKIKETKKRAFKSSFGKIQQPRKKITDPVDRLFIAWQLHRLGRWVDAWSGSPTVLYTTKVEVGDPD